jgi:hypothetical protein
MGRLAERCGPSCQWLCVLWACRRRSCGDFVAHDAPFPYHYYSVLALGAVAVPVNFLPRPQGLRSAFSRQRRQGFNHRDGFRHLFTVSAGKALLPKGGGSGG